ncbi:MULTISPECIES: dephospho-CoA kinase [Ramlibacter]|uniref:Dephospho-CoA kinase n=1 Tax=Ramlibacter aquaticus TaxID=2780094 RepID=A0ABR9SBW8_9BURK|nr:MULTISPECIES: dephospho-CoA kinase [Ramlibacter]MBE7939828.1 dephospho-CoA kinase [Ramlibacter aquaticus]
MLRIGLTGGIGSGKSTVLQMLAGHGAACADADAISRATTAAGGPAIAAIRDSFGPDFITPEGALDRTRMRELAMADSTARARLEAIVHPLVALGIAREVEAAERAGRRCMVFDIPLLVESGRWRAQLDRILVVDCAPQTQVSRVMARSGLAEDAVRAILAAQASRAQRLAAADLVVCNEGLSMAQLAQEVATAARRFGL